MLIKENIAFANKVEEKEAEEVFHVLATSMMIVDASTSEEQLEGKSIYISFFSRAIEEAMQNRLVKSKEDRLKVIKFLDKLNQQKEAIEFTQRDNNHLQIAAERLSRKSQSAFSASKAKK